MLKSIKQLLPHWYGSWIFTRYNPTHNFTTFHRHCRFCGSAQVGFMKNGYYEKVDPEKIAFSLSRY